MVTTTRNCRNTRVAVIGGAGFLGSHLVNHLIDDRGCKVLVIDNLIAGRREFVHKNAMFIHHDITDSEERLRDLFEQHKIKYVFNYAACPYIPVSFARPIHVSDVNFMGAMKVINAAQEAGCDGILQVSSAEIYGGCDYQYKGLGDQPKLTETTTVNPHSSYGVAKAAVDNWVQVRWREAKTPCIALRQFNCVGERETHPYIVPEIISQFSKLRPEVVTGVILLGNNSFRDFLYAGDAVKIAVELLERGQFGGVYNLGSETGINMYDLVKVIGELMGFADMTIERDEARVRPWEIWRLQSDNSKIKEAVCPHIVPLIDYVPTESTLTKLTSLREALAITIKWYNGNGRKWPWEV